ncbi:iron-regulated transporter [Dipodascopsis tothii]|uniref:iron-regulated transporter n=1 Tax=Dipodascopsis tothii TaxID=44089 RepID=UPI0034CD71F5
MSGNEQVTLPVKTVNLLQISHFLSTWNSRVFEFSATLFLALIFPGTMVPLSVYALARALAAIVLSPAVGKYIDRHDRLPVIRDTIIWQRVAAVLSGVLFLVMATLGMPGRPMGVQVAYMAGLVVFACGEKLSAIANQVAVENDWVVVIAGGSTANLMHLNSLMRRIDLFCKMMGPLVIALLIGLTVKVSIWLLIVVNFVSLFAEYYAIANVYGSVPELQVPKTLRGPIALEDTVELADEDVGSDAGSTAGIGLADEDEPAWQKPRACGCVPVPASLAFYLGHPAVCASLALAVLYFTVLSFGGQFVAFLLASGYSSATIGVMRTFSVMCEMLATYAGPWLMKRIGYTRAGAWFVGFELACVTVASVCLWTVPLDAPRSQVAAATAVTVTAVIFSRIGLRGFDLAAQLVIQESVADKHRAQFRAVESSFLNFFELLSFLSTIVFSTADTFFVPATLSTAAVFSANVFYGVYMVRAHAGVRLSLPAALAFWRREGRIQLALDDDDVAPVRAAALEQHS